MPERSVFADCKPGDWIVTNNKGMYQLHSVRPDGRVTIGSYGQFHPDGTGHIGRISLTARPATPDEVADHLAREAERHRKWLAEQDAEQRLDRIRDHAEQLLASLRELLPHAERDVKRMNEQMVGSLYPAINESKIQRARDVIAAAEPPPIT